MNIFLIIITNLFTGALIYLLLSLKLERTSSTYHEKKLKREMGEIITEFNATAERNITILENKISLLRNLNKGSESVKQFDYTVSDDDFLDNGNISSNSYSEVKGENRDDLSKMDISQNSIINSNNEGKLSSFINRFSSSKKNLHEVSLDNTNYDREVNSDGDSPSVYGKSGSSIIEKKIVTGEHLDFKIEDEVDLKEQKVKENIEELFDTSEDKYSLINHLHGKGYSVEELALHSGMSVGEVRLIISLNL